MVSDNGTSKTFEKSFLNNLKKYETNGYLICDKCRGYYKLKEGESPEDFDECECGGNLEYYETIDKHINRESEFDVDNDHSHPEELDELNQLIDDLKNKAEKRKELFEDLSKRISVQEKLLEKVRDDKWSLWESIEERNLERDIKKEKGLINSVIKQEDRLLNFVDKQRAVLRSSSAGNDTVIFGWIVGFGALVVVIIIMIYIFFR